MPENLTKEKPAKVAAAVNMMYFVVAIGIVRTGMTVVRHLDVRSPHFYISTKLLVYAVAVFLIYQANKGRNWARWSLIAIFALAEYPVAVTLGGKKDTMGPGPERLQRETCMGLGHDLQSLL